MILLTERLKIVELDISDVEEIHKMHLMHEVARYNTIGIPKDISETQSYLQPGIDDQRNEIRSIYNWFIRSKDKGEFIGEMGMSLAPERFKMAEIHYSLVPHQWGNGYALEAVKRIITFGFEELGLHRIQAGVATENLRSIKLLEKAGMPREGLKRKILPIRGEWKDNYHCAILEDDERGY